MGELTGHADLKDDTLLTYEVEVGYEIVWELRRLCPTYQITRESSLWLMGLMPRKKVPVSFLAGSCLNFQIEFHPSKVESHCRKLAQPLIFTAF